MADQRVLTPELSTSHPLGAPDFDGATTALTQASAILDVLAVLAEETETDIPDTDRGSLVQSLYAAKSEVDRARALFAKVPQP